MLELFANVLVELRVQCCLGVSSVSGARTGSWANQP